MELPTQGDLVQLAPDKKVDVIEGTMAQIFEKKAEADEARTQSREVRSTSRGAAVTKFAPAGQGTQLVVGATPSTDQQILATASHLYKAYDLKRIYYSGFSPFPQADARLPIKPVALVREHRLYQADWLMRYYGFEGAELTTPDQPNLDLTRDPKLTWALAHREFFPVDVNKASREALLRVPGIGYRNVERILRIRAYHPLSLDDLKKLNVRLKTVSPFVTAVDHTAAVTTLDSVALPEAVLVPAQMQLFDAGAAAATGQL